jgi:hypothetical protein
MPCQLSSEHNTIGHRCQDGHGDVTGNSTSSPRSQQRYHIDDKRPVTVIPLYADTHHLVANPSEDLANEGWDLTRLESHGDLQGQPRGVRSPLSMATLLPLSRRLFQTDHTLSP